MLQSIIGVLFGTNNKIKIQLDKSIYYTGEEVKHQFVAFVFIYLLAQITGTVLFEINETFEYHEIIMKFNGSENGKLKYKN